MKRTWTIIGVSDVARSARWYQSLFGQAETRPAHDHFGQILDTDGTVLLCLHQWGAHEHPTLTSAHLATPGNGLLLFFRVDDYDRALERARSLADRFAEDPHANPNTQTMEFSLRDPDGYYVTISALPTRGTALPTPKIGHMGYNPANFAHHMGTGPWLPGYRVSYAVSFYDAATGRESPRSRWWGPKTDPKGLYGGFGLIRIPVDPTGQATARRIWRRFEGEVERLIREIPDNVTTKYQDDVL